MGARLLLRLIREILRPYMYLNSTVFELKKAS